MGTLQYIAQYWILMFLALFALRAISCRTEVKRHRAATLDTIKKCEWISPNGTITFDSAQTVIKPGAEEIKYGLFRLDAYSRRFLIQHKDLHFLAIVFKGRDKPYVKLLEPQRAELVSRFSEWSTSVA